MLFSAGLLECKKYYSNTRRDRPFRYLKIEITRSPLDVELLDRLELEAKKLSLQVTKRFANKSNAIRDENKIYRNSLAGLLAEWSWQKAINYLTKKETLTQTDFTVAQEQIDLVSDTGLKIEIRSSFPRKGIKFALCNPDYEFDVIGPYVNSYKPSEIQKDYYLRTLYPVDESHLISSIKSRTLNIYLTGGATSEMFSDPKVYVLKSMRANNESYKKNSEPESRYKAIPFSKALDTFEIAQLFGYTHKTPWVSFEAV